MKRTIFIGQAMPRYKRDPHDWPTLNSWLYSIGITHTQIQENFYYSALVDYFPGALNGSHRVPNFHEIEKERERLFNTITNFNPEIMVPVGKLSISYCFNRKAEDIKNYIGQVFRTNPYMMLKRQLVVIPLPHPSGASTWRYKTENELLLYQALDLLKNNLSSN